MMAIIYQSRFNRTISYRISATIIAQIFSWLVFNEVIINSAVLLADMIQFGWYYLHDLWVTKWVKIEKWK